MTTSKPPILMGDAVPQSFCARARAWLAGCWLLAGGGNSAAVAGGVAATTRAMTREWRDSRPSLFPRASLYGS